MPGVGLVAPARHAISQDDVQKLLRDLRRMPEAFAALFAPEDEDVLHDRAAGEWSAVEVVCHLADHDAFERSERFEPVLSTETPTLPDDNTRFEVARLDYQAHAAVEALAFFRRERHRTVTLLEDLDTQAWLRTGIHPNDGTVTLLQLADLRGHDQEHLGQAMAAIARAKQ